MTGNQRIEIHIDELILHGFAVSDRNAIGDALIRELGELAANRNFNVNAIPRYSSSIRAPQIKTSYPEKPTVVGGQIAHAIYNSLNAVSEHGRGQ